MSLTDREIAVARPREKPYCLYDQQGLYLEVHPRGSKYWRVKYYVNKCERRLSLGVYPNVSLKDARLRTNEVRVSVDRGIDPGQVRQAQKVMRELGDEESFSGIAREWLVRKEQVWSQSHAVRVKAMIKRDLNPWLGNRAAREITPPELLVVLRRIEARADVPGLGV